MSTPLITIFVRHSPGCKYAGDEFCKRCACRKHFRWSQGGKQFRKQAGTRSWVEAEENKERLAAQLSGRVTENRAPDAKTLTDARDAFLKGKKVKKVSPGAYAKYELGISRLVKFCEARNVFTVAGLDLELLTDYKATWPEIYPSTNTQHVVQLCLRVFLNYCHHAGWLARVPKLDPVKVDEPPTTPLSDEEYAKLLAAVPLEFQNGTAAKVRAIIQLMRWSGLAVQDACCIRREEIIHHAKGVWHVRTSRQKTGVHVRVPVPERIAKEILDAANPGAEHLFWDPENASALNFAKTKGNHISRVFDRAGIECDGHMVSHRLRDTFACHLLGKGVPLEEVSKLLGHKSISTTEKHYAPWVKGRQDRVDELVVGTWK